MNVRMTLAATLLSLAGQSMADNGDPQDSDPWQVFRLLEGHWSGEIAGRLGTGQGVRRYRFIHDGTFVEMRHTSVRPPQEKSPRGDHHKELAIFSYDRDREALILREFLVEGFVNQYVCDVEPTRFRCTTESVENGPDMKARLTIDVADAWNFTETFEIAGAGKDLEVFFANRWTRVPSLED